MSAGKNIQQQANEHYASRFDDEMRALLAAVDDYDNAEKSEAAIEELREMPLSFQKIVTYHVREEVEWEILLGTGGPADRVIVRTDFTGTVESAEYQFQDRFEPWTAAENQDEKLVKRFAEIVGYGRAAVDVGWRASLVAWTRCGKGLFDSAPFALAGQTALDLVICSCCRQDFFTEHDAHSPYCAECMAVGR